MLMLSGTELTSYAAGLYGRLAEAVFVPRINVLGTEPGKCHDNVAAYIAANPGSERVTGWLAMPISHGPLWFHSHSIVRTVAGNLIDVTPLADERLRLQFLPDDSPTFFALLESKVNPILEYWPNTAD